MQNFVFSNTFLSEFFCRSAITIFPPRKKGKHDFRVWSPQFIRYAGYKQYDGAVIGDPSNVELTEVCMKQYTLGWFKGSLN